MRVDVEASATKTIDAGPEECMASAIIAEVGIRENDSPHPAATSILASPTV